MKTVTWQQVAAMVVLVGAPLAAHAFYPGAVAAVTTAAAPILAWLIQSPLPPAGQS